MSTRLGRTALVTGASAGIGVALAREFARNGFDLVLTARRTERLLTLARELHSAHRVQTHIVTADLADPTTPARMVEGFARDGLRIDVLVNNAGYALAGGFRDASWEAQRDCLQVLVGAPCELAHRLIPAMQAQSYGRILNVASVAGLLPGSLSHSLYGAAKAFFIGFSQALHAEYAGSGIHVSALCPGLTYSEFHDVNGSREKMRRVPKFLWLDPERVAAEGYAALEANRVLCVPGLQYKAITAVTRLLPRRTAHVLAAKFRRR